MGGAGLGLHPSARPESHEPSQGEAQGPGKSAKVLHQTKGGARTLPQMPRGIWQGQSQSPPCPHTSGQHRAGMGPPCTRLCVQPSRPGAPSLSQGARKLRRRSGIPQYQMEQLHFAAPSRNTRLQTAHKVCILELRAVRSSPPFLPPPRWSPISGGPGTN